MNKLPAIVMLYFVLTSCSYFKPEEKPQAVARVGESYLFKSDLVDLVSEGTSKEDSISIVRSFIDRWATQKLLIKAAEVNISKEQQEEFDRLIQQYKVDLYTKAYLEQIVQREVDTVVSTAEIKSYYDENKDNFRTNGSLIKLRYINLPKDHPKFELIKGKFFDAKKSDAKFWETYQLQFKSSALNDSVWVEMNQIYRKLPFITPDNRENYIVEGKAIQQPDSLNIYFVKIRNVIDKNEVSPFDYVKPTIKELIINKRKLDLIKKFEKEITDDAIKNNKYEIYK
ncbi:hypothetical protein M0M57_00155 [Flavobacterium azooxidireducens]|uniref:Peptidyl-prolyl cis-trans isomerase n=1 Tax=Flavobacterium azooxidireducens TaxID=1871076 RepID=A0ABY4KEN5_9FLAO|nr:hypothetical protein [Flavobacterium azooxidireducens]UPQ79269.1 hypothetical protein M0M57_00155 [Flavobacterium azooxidireducens]